MIKIKSLSYTVNNSDILKDINISFQKGEIAGIIGGSGSGKTTLLKAIAGRLKSFSGEILINNVSIKAIPSREKEKHISAFLNNPSGDIIDDTVFNFLLQARKPFKKILSPFSEFDIQITEEYLKIFDLTSYKGRKVLSLSEGIIKKILLAFYFIKEAGILIMDNPTSTIDINSSFSLQKAMAKFVIHGNKTIIIASNDLNFIFQNTDRVLIMKEGKIEEEIEPGNINPELINKYLNADVLITRNIYNGKPNIHQFSTGK